MQYEPISNDRIAATRNLRESAGQLRARIQLLLGLVGEALSNDKVVAATGVCFSLVEEVRHLANIDTPTGKGRLILDWASDSEGLMGVISIEKAHHDQYDKQYWEQVWAVNIPRWANPYVGTTPQSRMYIDLDDSFGGKRENSIFQLALSLIAVISTRTK